MSCKDIEDWFTAIECDLAAIPGGLAALQDPARVFNANKTGFALDASTGRVVKVIAERGAKHVYKQMQGLKMQISIIGCSSPSGNLMPPMIIYPGQWVTKSLQPEYFSDAIFAVTESGWMNADLFLVFLQHFEVHLTVTETWRPVILFINGYSSHTISKAVQYCADHGIILYTFLANSTMVLQPFDVSIFSEVKSEWSRQVNKWMHENEGEVLMKSYFAQIFKEVWNNIATHSNIKKAFEKAGIFPFTVENVDWDQLLKTADEIEAEQMRAEAETTPPAGAAAAAAALQPTASGAKRQLQLTLDILDGKIIVNKTFCYTEGKKKSFYVKKRPKTKREKFWLSLESLHYQHANLRKKKFLCDHD